MFNLKGSSKLSATLLALILGASVFMAGQVWAAKYVTDAASGITWTAPEYGGTLTWGANGVPKSTGLWAPGGWTPHLISGVNEKLVHGNWAISREKVAELAWIYSSPEMYRGALAESWEMPDDTTWIWNIRQGVYYHD